MHPSRLDNHVSHQRKNNQHKISREKLSDKQYKKVRSINLLKEFTQNSTIHGVQHIFREGETPLHRFMWVIFFTTCLTGAIYFIYDSWTGYLSVPIIMSVVETSYPLDAVYFPAVSVCPSQKIVLSKAMEYLKENLDNETTNDFRIHNFLKALNALQHPFYYSLSLNLNQSGELLQKLEILNITELMIKSLPSCDEMFFKCYWQGSPINCCASFHLQSSEMGFCYSFNSFTSNKYKNCTYKDKNIEETRHCKLMTTSGTGPGSGIGILFKPSNSSEKLLVSSNSKAMEGCQEIFMMLRSIKQSYLFVKLGYRSVSVKIPKINYAEHFKALVSHQDLMQPNLLDDKTQTGGFISESEMEVQVHHPNEYPEPGIGTLIPKELEKMNILVKATITESSDEIRKMSSKVSGCYFKDSVKSVITRIYSQKSCLFECRMLFLIKKCGCLPYYIVMEHFQKICNVSELLCIAAHREQLQFYRPPSASAEVNEVIKKKSLDCTHCLPTCNERRYEVVVIDSYINPRLRSHKYVGHVEIYYKDTGVVKYQREMSYNFIQLVVNIGGIGGLFLGASLVSLLEALYWFTKALIIYMWPTKEKKTKPKEKLQTKKTVLYNQGWLD